MVVGMELGPADGSEPAPDLFLFVFGEGFPKMFMGDFKGKDEGGHFHGVLVMILGGAPVFRGGGVGSRDEALPEPFGNGFAGKGFRGGRRESGGGGLEPVGGPKAGTGEGFEAVGLGSVATGFAEDGKVGFSRLHQLGQGAQAFLGHAEPVEISPGGIRFYHQFSFWQAVRASVMGGR